MGHTYINDSGTWRSIKDVWKKDSGGTWQRIKNVYVNDNGTWRNVHQMFTASVDNNYTTGYSIGSTITTASVTASGNGGWPGYTYVWQFINWIGSAGPAGNPFAGSSSSATTSFTMLNPNHVQSTWYALFQIGRAHV